MDCLVDVVAKSEPVHDTLSNRGECDLPHGYCSRVFLIRRIRLATCTSWSIARLQLLHAFLDPSESDALLFESQSRPESVVTQVVEEV